MYLAHPEKPSQMNRDLGLEFSKGVSSHAYTDGI